MYQKVLRQFNIEKTIGELALAFHLTDKLFMRDYAGVLEKNAKVFFPWYIGVLHYHLQLELDIEQVLKVHKQMKKAGHLPRWRPFPATHRTLRTLKQSGYTLGLISNWDGSARDVMQKNNLTGYFQHLIISSEAGVSKPDHRIFELALQSAKVAPEECLYVGDNYYDDVQGSRKAGIRCLLVNRFGRKGIEEIDYPHVISDVANIFRYLKQSATARKSI